MEQEKSNLVRRDYRRDMEIQIAFHGAPLIAGLKLSNLLMIECGDMNSMKKILKRTGISYFVIAVIQGRAAVLLFDREKLESYIQEEKVWQMFQRLGYRECELGRILYVFRLRYERYLIEKREFPHEMGLLLGYPVEDVEGYICFGGKNCLYTGYWKVYEKATEKKKLFHEFEQARNTLLYLLSKGIGIVEIIQKY